VKSQTNAEPEKIPPTEAREGQAKKRKSKKSDLKYVQFETADGSILEGLVQANPKGQNPNSRDLVFDKCYRIKDVGKIGRRWAVRDTGENEKERSHRPAQLAQ